MKFTILTVGTEGNVRPFVALGLALMNAGHDVTLCGSARFEGLAAPFSLKYAPINEDLLTLVETPAGRAAMESPLRALRLINKAKTIMRKMLDEQ